METTPIRTCIVTRSEHPKEALLRFVVGPEDQLVADVAGKLPGRGMYVTCSKLLVAEALAKRSFSRAAQQQVLIPEHFLDHLTKLMETRVCEALSMARKGGLVLSGFEKVEEALKKGTVAALIHASDAGEDGKKKLRNLLKDSPRPDFLRVAEEATLGNPTSPVNGRGDQAAPSEYQLERGGEASPLSRLRACSAKKRCIDIVFSSARDARLSKPLGELSRSWVRGELTCIPTYEFLSREVLGQVVGRENAAHVAVLHGPAAAFFLTEARRFALFIE